MEVCQHKCPKELCWTCHPEILEEYHRVYEANMKSLGEWSSWYPELKELYEDVKCLGVALDWNMIFDICRYVEGKHGYQGGADPGANTRPI